MSQSYLKWLFRSPKSLTEEFAEICDRIVQLRKIGLNTEDEDDPYHYLRIVDMCNELKGQLFERGVMFVPTDLEQNFERVVNRHGEEVERCTVKTGFELIRKQERLSLGASFGSAQNRSDKALAVAQTAAFKAWLKRVTMIYGQEDDPEANRDTMTPKEAVRVASYQKRAWEAAVRDSGLTAEKISDELSAVVGFPIDALQIPNLPSKDFDVCMKWLLSHQDLSAQWAKAVEEAKAKRGPQPVVKVMDHQPQDELDVAGD